MVSSRNNSFKFCISDFIPFTDGLDISINLSILVYLSSFFFESLDTRFAIIAMSFLILLSFFSRIFDLKVSSFLIKTRLKDANIFSMIFVFYLLPVLMQGSFPNYVLICGFIIFRIMIGILFSLSYRNVKVNNENQSTNILSLKYWLFYFFGLSLGVALYLLINQIYSNDFLNNGGWKIVFIFMLSVMLILFFLSKFVLRKNIIFNHKLNQEQDIRQLIFSPNCFNVFIPLLSVIMFATSSWMPKFSNPENLYFLSYDFLYLFLTLLILIFIRPIATLVGRKKSITFINLSIFLISVISSFLSHNSSYSIDFLKFFIALVASFTICCFILHLEFKKIDKIESISFFNSSAMLLSFLIPILFYFFIFVSINYSVIYIFLALVYFMNYIIFYLRKNG